MPFAKFKFQPGINKEGTNYSNEGGWFDADKIRFRKGRPERIGGWQKNSGNSFIGTARKIHVYKDADQIQYNLIGTHKKLYVQQGNVFYDITPIRLTTGSGDVTFSASNGDATLTVADSINAVNDDPSALCPTSWLYK